MGAGEGDLALEFLNSLRDQWAAERLQIYESTRTTATLTASQASFTLGSGGNIDIVRPVYLDHVHFQDTSVSPTEEYPLTPLTEDAYAAIPQKAQTATLPSSWYYNPRFATSRGTLWPFPIPTSSTLQWVIYAPTAVPSFAALTTSLSVPPGYERMIRSNLAMELAPAFGKQIEPWLREMALNSVAVVKRANMRMTDMSLDPGALGHSGVGHYNIYSDQG